MGDLLAARCAGCDDGDTAVVYGGIVQGHVGPLVPGWVSPAAHTVHSVSLPSFPFASSCSSLPSRSCSHPYCLVLVLAFSTLSLSSTTLDRLRLSLSFFSRCSHRSPPPCLVVVVSLAMAAAKAMTTSLSPSMASVVNLGMRAISGWRVIGTHQGAGTRLSDAAAGIGVVTAE
jgi:hypothetical protein